MLHDISYYSVGHVDVSKLLQFNAVTKHAVKESVALNLVCMFDIKFDIGSYFFDDVF